MTKKKRRAALLAAAVLFPLCLAVTNPFRTNPRKTLANRLEELEKQNAELRKQLDDLSTKVEVLTERLNAYANGTGEGSFTRQDSAQSAMTPAVPGLETVRLQPETAKVKEPAKPKGRLIITHSSPRSTVLIEHGAPLPGTNYVPLPDPAKAMAQPGTGAAPPPAPSDSPAADAGAASPRDQVSAFKAIKALVDQDKSGEAAPLMDQYLKKWPQAAHADKVANWLGSYYFSRSEYQKAIKTLKIVTEQHYDAEVAPESLYKIGLAHLELGQTDEAAAAFREVKVLYPFSAFAGKAEEKLSSCCP